MIIAFVENSELGRIISDENGYFLLGFIDLQAGETLRVYAKDKSGNISDII
ncbi:MAG: hypothetical protein RR657_02835 [Peptostreptococcaceae bacterium]